LTARERIIEINKIAQNQLKQSTDLPPNKQLLINGKRITIKEIPMDPMAMDAIFPSDHPYLPEAERTYIKGREWSIG